MNLDQFILPEKLRQRDLPALFLASQSPRRQELLKALGIPFQSQGTKIPEDRLPGELPETFVLRLAFEKSKPDSFRNILLLSYWERIRS